MYSWAPPAQAFSLSSWFQGYVEDKALARTVVQEPSYAQMADINSVYAGSVGGATDTNPQPSTDVATVQGSAILALSPPDDGYLDQLSGKRSGIIEYIVQDGDLLSFIASDYGVSQASIIWANGLKNANALTLGQTLRIPPVTGVVHKVVRGDTASSLAKKYAANVERIISYNSLPKDGSLSVGDEVIVPDGTVSRGFGVAVASKKSAVAVASSFTHLPDLKDYFVKPTTGVITRGGAIHGRNGIDIANGAGTPILAAADGVVTIADSDGYNGGYGKYVKIRHANGTETLYGHASKLLVSVGQSVAQGTKIALMGSTGNSTGSHLHFEVHGAKNPLAK